MIKKSHFITLFFIILTPNIHTMVPENNPNKQWINFAADTILNNSDALRELLSSQNTIEHLPLEIQQAIITLLAKRINATTLKDAAHAINSLEQINEQLNQLINDPIFSLQIIKRLAQQFNCSDKTATMELKTQEAQKRLDVQRKFEKLFVQKKFEEESFRTLYAQYKNYVDLNFTYRYKGSTKNFKDTILIETKDTLLIKATQYKNKKKATKIICLLRTNSIDVNYQNIYGMTALMICATTCRNTRALELLATSPGTQINLQDKTQTTALHQACWCRNKPDKFEYIKILLRAGADPEIANQYGYTPLMILKKNGADEKKELNLIEEAIRKKHEKK